ncbi:MAG: putative amidohydrolase YtcJ [Arenicella sp.]|jgi:predicted amidohydrolase YtcJ
MYAAVTRCTLDDKNPDGGVPQEKISIKYAVRAYTLNNAVFGFKENN